MCININTVNKPIAGKTNTWEGGEGREISMDFSCRSILAVTHKTLHLAAATLLACVMVQVLVTLAQTAGEQFSTGRAAKLRCMLGPVVAAVFTDHALG